MVSKKPHYTTLFNINNSLFEKELEIKSFSVPRFIRRCNTPLFLNNANVTNNDYLFKPMRTTLGVFNKNYTDSKESNLKKESLNNVFNSSIESVLNNSTVNHFSSIDKSNNNGLLNKELETKGVNNSAVFTSYIEKLNQIADKVKQINVSKSTLNHIHKEKTIFNNHSSFNKFNVTPQYNRQTCVGNSSLNNKNFYESAPNLNNNFKSTFLTNSSKKEVAQTLTSIKPIVNENKKESNNKEINFPLNNSIKEIKCILKDLEVKNQRLYNKLLSELDKKVHKKLFNIIPAFEEIKSEIKSIANNKNLIGKNLKITLQNIESNLSELRKTIDLNGVDLEVIQDLLKEFNLNEILFLLKDINQHAKQILNEKDKIFHSSLNEESISKKIISLEERINISNKEQFTFLTQQIKNLNTTQEEGFKTQVENKKVIINEINSIKNTLNNTKPNTLDSLNSKLNDIMLSQKNLLSDAVEIKEYVLNNNKEISYIKDTQNNNNKIINLIDDFKNKNFNKEKEQVQLNEKMHQDMEIIKKSIIKLIEKQQKTLNNNINSEKHANIASSPQNNNLKQPVHNVTNNIVKSTGNNTDTTEIEKNKTNVSHGKPPHISQIQMMAIGKLKEALDLESLEPTQNVTKEYIDELLVEHEGPAIKVDKKNKEEDNNKSNTSEDNQSTFVLDTSKFFK